MVVCCETNMDVYFELSNLIFGQFFSQTLFSGHKALISTLAYIKLLKKTVHLLNAFYRGVYEFYTLMKTLNN